MILKKACFKCSNEYYWMSNWNKINKYIMQKWNGISFIFMTFVLYRTMSEKECNSYRQVYLLKILGIISFLKSIRISIWYSISCWLQVWEPDHVHHSLQILLIMLLSISELTSSLSFDKTMQIVSTSKLWNEGQLLIFMKCFGYGIH